jgi:hypothetical protein
MIELRLVGWKKGLQTISLIHAVREYAGTPMSGAKSIVEDLLRGQVMTLQFSDRTKMETFRDLAEKLGVICE